MIFSENRYPLFGIMLVGDRTPVSGAVAAGGAVTQTLSGERPAGLRTTRAEPSEARTAVAFWSRTSTRIRIEG
jgi:hypothetical protein